jgi:ATP-dependent protease ClpP protease subunit
MNILSYRNEWNAMLISAKYKKPLDKPDWYKIEAVSDDEADILLYDYIGWPFNEASIFIRALDALKQRNVTIRINSPGGDVFDANAIFNAIKAHPSKPTTRIESLAASAASYIGVAGHKKEAYKNTSIMIHEPMTITYGNRFDHEASMDVLKQISDGMVDMYADNTLIGKREIRDLMTGEGKKDGTWMNAETAKKKGFIDTILEAGKPVKATFDLSIFSNLPDGVEGTPELTIFTGFDVEKALRDAKAPKGFAKAVAAACRTAKLVDWRQADDDLKAEEDARKVAEAEAATKELAELTAAAKKFIDAMK